LKRVHTVPDGAGVLAGGQYRLVCLFALLFVLGGALYTLGAAIGGALYISSLAPDVVPSRLPWVYVCAAVANAAFALVYDRLLAHTSRVRALVGGQLAACALFVAEKAWWLADTPRHYFALTIALDATSMLALTAFFGFASDYFEGRAARRMYTLFGGSIAVGTVLGGEGTTRLIPSLGVARLTYGFAGLLALSALVCAAIAAVGSPSVPRRDGDGPERTEPLRNLLADRLVRLAWLAFVLGMLLTVVSAFQMQWLARGMPRDALAAYFARFYAWVGAAELLLQFVLVPRILEALGVVLSLFVPPLVLALASGASLVAGAVDSAPALLLSTAVNGVRLTLEESMMLPVRELLFLPMPRPMRIRAQTFAGAVLAPAARGCGGLGLLAYVTLGGSAWALSGLVVLCACGLCAVVLAMRAPLRRALAGALSEPDGLVFSVPPELGPVEGVSAEEHMAALAQHAADLDIAVDLAAQLRAAEAVRVCASRHGVRAVGAARLAEWLGAAAARTVHALDAAQHARGAEQRAERHVEAMAHAQVLVTLASAYLGPRDGARVSWCLAHGNAAQQAQLVELLDAGLPRALAAKVCAPIHRCLSADDCAG
jgi:hypothetical protein